MSDHIPFEIQAEVIKRLPVKSLLQVRSVSKQWKALIDNSAFIAVSYIKKSLAVIEYIKIRNNQVCAVWMMKHEVLNSFTKLFIINTSYTAMRVLEFTETGEPIMEKLDYNNGPAALVVYKPSSQTMYHIGLYGKYRSFFVGSYMETLLLADEFDCGVYS